MRQVDTEFGWATLDCFRTTARYTDKNFLSNARRLDVSGVVSKLGYARPTDFARDACYRHDLDKDSSIASSIVNYSVKTTLQQPQRPGRLNPAYSLYREERGEYLAYLRRTFVGGEASASKDLGGNMLGRAAYTLEFGRTKAEPALLCAVFSRCDQESQRQVYKALPFAVASGAFQWRNTDNQFDPRRGAIVRAEMRGSSRFILSDTSLSFLKATVDGAWYHALAPRTVFAVRLRLGGINGGGSANGTKLPPPQERLYAGGATSVRGYQQNQLGALVYLIDRAGVDSIRANDTTIVYVIKSENIAPERVVPVGGNWLFVTNVDLRLRDPFFPNLIQYTLFTDAGAVWTQRPRTRLAGQQLKYTPGFAVRYFSPVGPIQVNVGYNPYGRAAGVAYYAPAITGRSAPLTCVTPSAATAIPIHLRSGEWTQDPNAVCPQSYAPPQSRAFLKSLTFTISIGPDF